jgi:hypothetical protein
MKVTEFLLARSAERESRAKQADWAMQGKWFVEADDKVDEYVQALDPRRVLRECAAIRRLVEEWDACANELDERGRPAHLFDAQKSMLLKSHAGWLRILAAVYDDHPDYDREWRA